MKWPLSFPGNALLAWSYGCFGVGRKWHVDQKGHTYTIGRDGWAVLKNMCWRKEYAP